MVVQSVHAVLLVWHKFVACMGMERFWFDHPMYSIVTAQKKTCMHVNTGFRVQFGYIGFLFSLLLYFWDTWRACRQLDKTEKHCKGLYRLIIANDILNHEYSLWIYSSLVTSYKISLS